MEFIANMSAAESSLKAAMTTKTHQCCNSCHRPSLSAVATTGLFLTNPHFSLATRDFEPYHTGHHWAPQAESFFQSGSIIWLSNTLLIFWGRESNALMVICICHRHGAIIPLRLDGSLRGPLFSEFILLGHTSWSPSCFHSCL